MTATYEKRGPFRNPLLRNVLRLSLFTRDNAIIHKGTDTLTKAIRHEANLLPFVHHRVERCAYLMSLYLTLGVLVGQDVTWKLFTYYWKLFC